MQAISQNFTFEATGLSNSQNYPTIVEIKLYLHYGELFAILTPVGHSAITGSGGVASNNYGRRSGFHPILVAISLVQAFVILAQGFFAGSFLSGSDSAVSFHEIGGWIALALALAQLAMLVGTAGRKYGLWLLMSSVGIVLGEALQLGSGYGRFLQVHIPLAVILVGGITWQILWIVLHPRSRGR